MKKNPPSRKNLPTVSVVIPVFNEVENIPILFDHLKKAIHGLPYNFETFFVDDGSTDGTFLAIKDLQQRDRNVKAISFSRNFGHQAALTAGLHYASGDAVITMDGDLQHPPSLIPTLIEKWREGYEIVYTTRESTADETFFKKMTSRLFYKIINAFSETPVQPFAADFRLLDRSVVRSLNTLEERDRFLRGLIGWLGFSTIGVPYTADPRAAGTSKYTVGKMMKLAFNGIISFSAAPLHAVTYLGLFASIVGFLYGMYSLYVRFFTNDTVQGWTSLVIVILFLGGVQLISIGILGEYLIRVYDETKRRPLYIVRNAIGLDDARKS
ncbi:MAG: glycosyltransferase family 2 protein [Ignavibacteriales bacterium]|nr:glycosyltransferase family 2 protein [Ignavibacteriales bacterium]